VSYALYVLPQKVDMASRRYFDVPHLVAEVSGCSIPYDLDRIRLLLSPVVVSENKASDDIDLESQLQIITQFALG
jgi:hypothetical protein